MKLVRWFLVMAIGGVVGVLVVPFLPQENQDQISSWQNRISASAHAAVDGFKDDDREIDPAEMVTSTATAASTPTTFPRANKSVDTPSPDLKPTPTSSTNTSANKGSAEELEELRQLALKLINDDRAAAGLNPVKLGSNPAAQFHAEEALLHRFVGHWWTDGQKPYMVYSDTGGTSYIGENAAGSGWSFENYAASNCDSFLVRCQRGTPEEDIRENHWRMVNDDASSNWGHRDNILDPTHLYVNIGIAYNDWWTAFYQHFEGGHFTVVQRPIFKGTTLTFSIQRNTETFNFSSSSIGIFYDPEPQPMTVQEIESLNSYCVGGGPIEDCGPLSQDDRMAAWIVEPPRPGWFYNDLSPVDVVASVWANDGTLLNVVADLGTLISKPGIYTVVVWGDANNGDSAVMVELSVVKLD